MKYRLKSAEIVDGIVELPTTAIPLQVGLILTGKLMDADCKMRDGIKYLEPLEDDVEIRCYTGEEI